MKIKVFFKLSFLFLFVAIVQTALGQDVKKIIEFDDIFKNRTFYSPGIRGFNSMNDGIHYTAFDYKTQQIVKKRFDNDELVDVLFDIGKFKEQIAYVGTYSFNKNEDKLMLASDIEMIYRRSYKANFYIYDIKKNTLEKLSENGKQQLATFSPDGNKVAFVRDNNLFYKDIVTGKEFQITNDGERNAIINGAPDWVYEEEFEFSRAFDWSPNSENIAWIRFDESDVPEFSMYMYQGQNPSLDEYKLYPGMQTFKYPKAGDPNSLVSVKVYNIKSGKVTNVDVGTETDQYIPRVRFTNDDAKLAVYRLNRLQNFLEILIANPNTGVTSHLYTEKNERYIDEKYFDQILFLDDNEHFIIMSEKEGYAQLYLYKMDGKLKNKITEGNFDVTDFYGCNQKDKIVYFQAALPNPYQREVLQINLDGSNMKKISVADGNNYAYFSATYEYFLLNHSSVNVPPTSVMYDKNGKKIRTIKDNVELKQLVNQYEISYREFFSFKTSENVELNGWILKPYNFDSNKKYPVFMTQYSGPNSQSALDEWTINWENYLAANDYIVVCVDGRGTGGRGEEFRKCTYLQLGKYETIDQIETAKYLKTLPFVDGDRIGIWGWSFGGYISSSCLAKGDGIFKMGIAVAPVTNWRYYDNIYTERFMRTPQENPDGYDDNSPLNFAKDFKGKFLMCHGTADDNVHVQNAMELAERLVQANFQFDMQIYTNRNHGIYGGNTTYHLYTKKVNFIFDNL